MPKIGEKALARLLRLTAQNRLSPELFLSLDATELHEKCELQREVCDYLIENRNALLDRSEALAVKLRLFEVQLLSVESASYPSLLERFDDAPPPLLYALGAHSLLLPSFSPTSAPVTEPIGANSASKYGVDGVKTKFTFTIAVSNEAPPETLSKLETISTAAVRAGGVPVTGHDRLPYQRLALTAQRQNSSTIYVFDRGLQEALGAQFDRPPFAAARIRDLTFNRLRDLAISPFRLEDHSIGANNRRRDRLVFALSEKIVALEVRSGGSMFSECLRAFKQGKDVSVVESESAGNRELMEQGLPKFTPTE